MPVFWLHYDFLWHVCMLVRWIELDILRGCLMAHLTTRSVFTLGKNSIFEHKRNRYICKSNAVPIEGESLVKTSSHSLNYLLAADEWQWQASTKQWQANVECDDKSEFVVRQIRACGDKSASGAWQIQTTCESNTLCLSHLLVNRLGGLQLNATATMSLFVQLASSSLLRVNSRILSGLQSCRPKLSHLATRVARYIQISWLRE